MNKNVFLGSSAYWKAALIMALVPLGWLVLPGNAGLGFKWGVLFVSITSFALAVAGMMFGGGMALSAHRRGERGDLVATGLRVGALLGLVSQVVPMLLMLGVAWTGAGHAETAMALARAGIVVDGAFAVGGLLGAASMSVTAVAVVAGMSIASLHLVRRTAPDFGVAP